MQGFIEIDVSTFVTHIILGVFACVGMVDWLKNKIRLKHKRNYAWVLLAVVVVHVFFQLMPFIEDFWRLSQLSLFLLLGLSQTYHKTVFKVFEQFVEKKFGVDVAPSDTNKE